MANKSFNRNSLDLKITENGQYQVICPLTRQQTHCYKCRNCIFFETLNEKTKILICYTPEFKNDRVEKNNKSAKRATRKRGKKTQTVKS